MRLLVEALLQVGLVVAASTAAMADGPGPITQIKESAVAAGLAVNDVALKVGHGIKEGAVAAGHEAGQFGSEIGQAAKRSGRAVGHATSTAVKNTVQAAGNAASK